MLVKKENFQIYRINIFTIQKTEPESVFKIIILF